VQSLQEIFGKLEALKLKDPTNWTDDDRNLIKQVNELDKNNWK
jgi:hypothetical protein